MGIFKANDIRGRYPDEWDSKTAYQIGKVLPSILDGSTVVIGRDGRYTSDEIFSFLVKGLLEEGMNVTDVGLVDTPAVYFAVGTYHFDGGIMITASHNPTGYNGIKLTGKNAVPFEYNTGIERIERYVQDNTVETLQTAVHRPHAGVLKQLDIKDAYVKFLDGFKNDYKGITAVFDCSNGSAGRYIHDILKNFQGAAVILNDEIDGSFPSHGPNPSAPGSLDKLKKAVIEANADVGFCFDGDADRVVMVDDEGAVVSPDVITAILGQYFLRTEGNGSSPSKKILVDIRSSNSVSEYLQECGGNPVKCPAGHAKIKKMLRDEKAFFAGELTGHYYFRDNFFCDSAWISVFGLLNVLTLTREKLSVLSRKIMKYAFSGEMNFPLGDQKIQDSVISKLLQKYSAAEIDLLDGYRFNFSDWWFIIRKSGTEPLMRLVVEAETKKLLDGKIKELEDIIYSEGGSR